jgi:hypothetical protein
LGSSFPLARVKALERLPSDHNPLLVDSGDNIFYRKKHFRFEKWWLEEASFGEIVHKVWNLPCGARNSMDIWQFRIRAFRKMVRGWVSNQVAEKNKLKSQLAEEYNELEVLMES